MTPPKTCFVTHQLLPIFLRSIRRQIILFVFSLTNDLEDEALPLTQTLYSVAKLSSKAADVPHVVPEPLSQ